MDYEARLADAVRHFWEVRTRQHVEQGAATGRKDAGIDFRSFPASLTGRALAHARLRPTRRDALASREAGAGSDE